MIKQFDELAEKVRRHPMLQLLVYEVAAPASEDVIAAAQASLGVPLPNPIAALYRIANGLKLTWRVRPDVSASERGAILSEFRQFQMQPEHVFEIAGNVHLVSITDALTNPDFALPNADATETTFDFMGNSYPDHEFSRMLRVFDFIDDFSGMAFVVQPGLADWKLMLLTDNWIEYDSSRVTWLKDYLAFTASTWGLRLARTALFSKYRGDREPPLAYDPELARHLLPRLLRR